MTVDLVALLRFPEREGSIDEEYVDDLAEGIRGYHESAFKEALKGAADEIGVRRWRKLLSNLDGRQGNVDGGPKIPLKALEVPSVWRFFIRSPEAAVALLAKLDVPKSKMQETLTVIYEAWYELATDNAVPGVDRRSAASGLGFLARTRWALLSEPFRQKVDGPTKSEVARARQAREEWISVLDTIDDYPNLRAVIDVEAEAKDIVSVRLQRENDADPAWHEVVGHVITRLLLPRFAWGTAFRIIWETWGRKALAHFVLALSLFFAAVAIFVITVLTGWQWGYTAAAGLALAGYCVVGFGAALRPHLGWPWLLRQPAGAAVGLLALVALPINWVTAEPFAAVVASGVLALVGVGYIAVEEGNHGAQRIVRRAIGVGSFGLFQAAMVSLIGLRFLFPVFAAAKEGAPLTCWWDECTGNGLPPGLLLVTATTWSFAVGVFLQITWNDQPITAPLAHVSWRRGR